MTLIEGCNDGDVDCRALSSQDVPLRKGPPTREELLVHYPSKFTWEQLKTFVNSGDLALLKRDRRLQTRYIEWLEGIEEQYGSVVNYLQNYRLQWGQPDTLSLLRSSLDDKTNPKDAHRSYSTTGDAPLYFKADISPELISIIQNDWPYSVPPNIEHTLVWTRLPIFHASIIPERIAARVEQDGLWGFTGAMSPPPSPSLLPSYLPTLSEWGITMDQLVRSQKGTPEEDNMVRQAGYEVHEFVKNRWVEQEWETAWFVNPPRIQSVPGLAHIHVFARRKTVPVGAIAGH